MGTLLYTCVVVLHFFMDTLRECIAEATMCSLPPFVPLSITPSPLQVTTVFYVCDYRFFCFWNISVPFKMRSKSGCCCFDGCMNCAPEETSFSAGIEEHPSMSTGAYISCCTFWKFWKTEVHLECLSWFCIKLVVATKSTNYDLWRLENYF